MCVPTDMEVGPRPMFNAEKSHIESVLVKSTFSASDDVAVSLGDGNSIYGLVENRF